MGAVPRWIGYVEVDNVEATVDRIKRLGGTVHVPPTEIPNVSCFSVIADPQMATLTLVKWLNPAQEQPAALGEPGRVGWHELLAADWEKAFAFYSELFGWRKADAEIGSMGTYQMFSAGGQTIGGMSTKPPMVPMPFWLYYFNIDDIDAAAERVKAGGGRILEGPLEVRGGGWIARCTDPQGAMFALVGSGATRRSDISSRPRRAIPLLLGFLCPRRPRRQCGRLIVRLNGSVLRRGQVQIDRPGPRRGIRAPSFSRTDRYSWCRSHSRRAPYRSPSGKTFASTRQRP